jgi:putative ABC transport system ATP-binding protein
MIQLRGVSKHYTTGDERLVVLSDLDLDVAAGETVALTGDSGCGKTTLLHLIAGFDHPDAGVVTVNGLNLDTHSDFDLSRFRSSTLGMVFQQFNLLAPLSVADNVRFPLRLLGRDDPAWIDELCGRLGIDGLFNRRPDELSGGQQQRVALARALAHRPPLLLADEPTGNLDEANSEQVMKLLHDLVAQMGTTVVMVTHSASTAGFMRRQVRLEHGQVHAV